MEATAALHARLGNSRLAEVHASAAIDLAPEDAAAPPDPPFAMAHDAQPAVDCGAPSVRGSSHGIGSTLRPLDAVRHGTNRRSDRARRPGFER